MDNLKSLGVRLSDLRKNKSQKKWSSDNVVVQEEPGDFYYGNERQRIDMLAREFKEYQNKVKEFSHKVKKQDIKPHIYDSGGNVIPRGDKPEFSQKNIIVTKSLSGGKPNIAKTLEALGNNLSEKAIKEGMDLQPGDIDIKGKKAVIGTFNIEWLGTKERSADDYKKIAQVIKDSKAQLLGVQEVANEDGLKAVMNHLPGYGYILGKSSNQKIAVLFDKERVKYDVNSIDQIDEAQGNCHLRSPPSC